MKYLVTFTTTNGMQEAYYTNEFDKKDLVTDLQMMVFDLEENKFLLNSCGWADIKTLKNK